MKRVMLTISYDGTGYCGWQIQENGITVEEAVTRAVAGLTGENAVLIGASRTDSGVHALGNVAVFDTDSPIPGEKFSFALNRLLPEDIVITDSKEVRADFHPRHCDCVKTYEYRIRNSRFPLATDRLYTYHIHRKLDIEAMRQGGRALVGEHDFSSFCSAGAVVQTKVRTIYSLEVLEGNEGALDDVITIRVKGNGFLYNMVRIIAGTLIRVGLGEIDPGDVEGILAAKDRNAAGPTAPAKGLTLVGINYRPEDLKL